MKRIAAALVLVSILLIFGIYAPTASGQQNNAASIQALLNQINELNKKIAELQNQKQATVTQLAQTLKEGDRGDLVEELQAFLAAEGHFKHRITGYFGPLTRDAVKEFQKGKGIPALGKVGPQTMAAIQAQPTLQAVAIENDNSGSGKKACLPPGKMIAPGQQKKGPSNLPSCKSPLPPGISKLLGQGGPGGPSGSGGGGTTTPDTIAPVISNLSASNVSSTTATIAWTTNEPATSAVWYSTSTPVTIGSPTPSVSSSTLVSNHSLSLTSLTASTTYYYVAQSADTSGNTATSSQQSFTTLAQ